MLPSNAPDPRPPLLSVVTPSYNMRRFLPDTIRSVARLSTPHEHIVVDGNSTDGTIEFLRSVDDADVSWISEPDRGQTHAVNKALAMAGGELIGWLNADDEYLPANVDRAIAELTADPSLDAVFGSIERVDAEGRPLGLQRPGPYSWWRYLYWGGYIPTPTVIFRRRLMERAGDLNEAYDDAADYDFYLRLLRRARVRRLRTPLVRFRYHAGSKTGSQIAVQLAEGQQIRLGWARNALERRMMAAVFRVRCLRHRIKPPWPSVAEQS